MLQSFLNGTLCFGGACVTTLVNGRGSWVKHYAWTTDGETFNVYVMYFGSADGRGREHIEHDFGVRLAL